MLVQNVQTDVKPGSGIFSFSTGKNAVKSDVFANLFNNITTNAATVQKVSGTQGEIKKQDVIQKDDSSKSVFTKNDKADNLLSENEKGLNTNTEKMSDGGKNVKAETTEVTVEDIEKVSAALTELAAVIADFFGISAEELQEFMKEAGFEMSDLTDSEKLQVMFVNIKLDGDETRLLTDEDALESLNDFLEVTAKVVEKAEVPDEKFAEILKHFTDAQSTNTDVGQKEEKEVEEIDGKRPNNVAFEVNSTEVEQAKDDVAEKSKHQGENEKSSDSERDKSFTEARKNRMNDSFTNRFVNHMFEGLRENLTGVEEMGQVARLRSIANQILTQIKANITPETTSLEIRLSPAHLGKVNIVIEDNNGVLTAKFQTENRAAKEAIENSLPQFKETLKEQGIKVENVEVSVSDFSFDKNKGSGENNGEESKKGNKRHFSLNEINEKVDGQTELQERVFLENGTSTVNYVA